MDDPNETDRALDVERMKAMNVCMQALDALVRDCGENVLRTYVLAELVDIRLRPQEIDDHVARMRGELEKAGLAPEPLAKALAEFREKLEGIVADSPEDTERVIRMATDDAVPMVVLAWVNALGRASSSGNGIIWLRLSLLGDDMLPKNDDEVNKLFDEQFPDDGPITPVVARDILKAVRADLPAGKVLPDQMAAALDVAWSVVLVP